MQDIGALLEIVSKETQCSVLGALLILLNEDEEDVCILQPESQQETCR